VPIRDNKLVRSRQHLQQQQQQQTKSKYNPTGEIPPTVEEQLLRLEDDIRKLKIEFDIYFNGGTKRPPYDLRNRVETMIKRIGDDRTLNFAQRYHYNTLATRYNSFRELWRRLIQGREEGRDQAAAARVALHAERQRSGERAVFVCDNAHNEITTVKDIFEALVEAKRRCGEPTDDLSFPRFHHLIATKTEKLKEHLGCQRVRFSIAVEEGRVSFKAKADEEQE
jgi:hypothetical protein